MDTPENSVFTTNTAGARQTPSPSAKMAGCATDGGCPSDYVGLFVSCISICLLLARSIIPFLIYEIPFPRGSAFWLPAIQVFASFNLVLSVVMSVHSIKMKKGYWWQSCYIWSVWVEGPLGFGLLLGSRIVQAFQLYFIFVKKRLPPIRSYIILPLTLFPWIVSAAFVHYMKPLNSRCQMSAWWIIPSVCIHSFYVAILMALAKAIRHVEFRFHEAKDLWRGVLVSGVSVGIWVAAYVLTKVHEDVEWIQVVSKFLLLIMTSIFIVAFFSMSSSHPLLSQMSLKKKEYPEVGKMGKALGIHDSGTLSCKEEVMNIDPNEPLDKLLSDKRFRRSFMEFADSCLAGESVHFYDEICELNKLPKDDSTRRIYMARHIIQKYIAAGAEMEVNISHRTRQQILNTSNLADPELFKNAINELLHLMKTNLVRDYWSSVYYAKFRDEGGLVWGRDLEMVAGWNVSPRLSSVHAFDDPFHQEHRPDGHEFDTDKHDS